MSVAPPKVGVFVSNTWTSYDSPKNLHATAFTAQQCSPVYIPTHIFDIAGSSDTDQRGST